MSSYKKLLLTFIFTLIGLSSAFLASAVYPVAGRFKFRYNGLFLTIFIFFAGLAFASPAYGATQVYYSIGQNTDDHKTGTPTVTVSGTTATFSVAQTAVNMGVGDKITYAGGTCYISGKTSTTVWSCVSVLGGTPVAVTNATVTSITHVFNSLSAAITGALGASYLNTANLVTGNYQLNLPCYYDSGPDLFTANITGYTTGATNFIKIYTPYNITTEVNRSQRHTGKPETGYYMRPPNEFSRSIIIDSNQHYTVIAGIGFSGRSSGDNRMGGIQSTAGANYVIIDSCEFYNMNFDSAVNKAAIYFDFAGTDIMIRNNFFANITGYALRTDRISYIYNNTAYDTWGIGDGSRGEIVGKNNISMSPKSGYSAYSGTWSFSSSNNVSSDATAPGTDVLINKTLTDIDFFNTTAGAEDLHIGKNSVARDVGENLSGSFTVDIDNNTRNASINIWDIGADEGATQIYRSVGPSKTDTLATDNSHANTVTIASGTATFSTALADDIGVGDAIIIDTGGTADAIDSADTLLFISRRNSSTSYKLQTHTGANPSNISINDTYSIYRAYTSLTNAEEGIKNTSIPITFNGGNRDLAVNNEQWNVACYANGITSDTVNVTVNGWTTNSNNFIKFYAPSLSNEVGISQRHSGKWNNGKYNLSLGSGSLIPIRVYNDIEIVGLQISKDCSSNGDVDAIRDDSNGTTRIIGNIIRENSQVALSASQGIRKNSGTGNAFIFNNIIYGWNGNTTTAYVAGITNSATGSIYAYNNTIYDARYGFKRETGIIFVKNNITQNCVDGYNGTFDPSSDFNISDISGDAPNATFAGGFADVQFVNEFGRDFHLAQADTTSRGLGDNLTNNPYFPLTTDVDGQFRNSSGAGWDIGADEGTVEFITTVMQSGGNFSTLSSWEDAIDSDLLSNSTRVFSHGGITGTIVGGNTVTGLTSGATATVIYATATQILLSGVSGTFQTGETLEVTSGNSIVISNNGNPASAAAKVDGTWTVADTTKIQISGWITGYDNYVKIYATGNARHQGKWEDSNRYRFEYSAIAGSDYAIEVAEEFVKIKGLQIKSSDGGNNYSVGICVNNLSGTDNNIEISENIIKAGTLTNTDIPAIGIASYYYGSNTLINNNIVYDFNTDGSSADGTAIYTRGYSYVHNNTIWNSYNGIWRYDGTAYASNNIVQNCTDGFNGTFDASSNYNVSSLASDAPSASYRSGLDTVVSFVSTTAGAEDFHIYQTDSLVKNFGADLAAYFNVDVDGSSRNSAINAWDIGADETATQIYRSVGPSATAFLFTDSSRSRTVSVTSGNATFSVALPENIGVGDALIIDTSNNNAIDANDSLFFIHGRVSTTVFSIRTHAGIVPANISSNDVWQIYRAHTSLSDAEAGNVNSSITALGFSFNSGNRDLIANNEEWNITCYANGNTADTTMTYINGWTTSAYNFLKVYTPFIPTEVGGSQRHDGRWSDVKYKLESSMLGGFQVAIYLEDEFVIIEGLQIKMTVLDDNTKFGIANAPGGGNNNISNNIVWGDVSSPALVAPVAYGIRVGVSGKSDYVESNIVYGLNKAGGSLAGITGNAGAPLPTMHLYNNTLYDNNSGIDMSWGNYHLKNNLAYNNSIDFYNSVGVIISSSNNLSKDATSPNVGATDCGGHSCLNQTVLFVDEANKDFHLSQSDTSAKDAGTDLSTYFTTDIDGANRSIAVNSWDIGADETSTDIFRSVGPGATGTLANDNAHANTVTLTSGIATFSVSLSNNIGVGDAVIIDTGGTDQSIDASDTLLFIHSRTSSTSYTLRTHTGATPSDIPINDTYQIYRAYTSLVNAESGTRNSSIPMALNGGNRDLVANNEQWNITCYANGTTADTASLTIDGWNTGTMNYLRIFTPVEGDEVGASQRHIGKWDEASYRLEVIANGSNQAAIYQSDNYVRYEGLQIKEITNDNATNRGGIQINDSGTYINETFVRENIIVVDFYTTNADVLESGFSIFDNEGTYYISNNIFYTLGNYWGGSGPIGVLVDGVNSILYNNTFYDYPRGISCVNAPAGTVLVKNNLVQSAISDGYIGTFHASSDYNISNLSNDAPSLSYRSNQATQVNFVNKEIKDFHLYQSDTFAREVGANLTNDSGIPAIARMTSDIDGQLRNPVGTGWDIGADEGTVEFVTTVMQSGGNFSTLSSWEDAMDSDLLADATRVFNHSGITGTIVSGNTVTGLTGGATATLVYATATQILLSSVSGIFQAGETLEVSAGNSVVISNSGNPASAVAKIDGSWTVEDSVELSIDGWISGPDNYIKIYTAGSSKHNGIAGTSNYRINPATNSSAINIYESYTIIDGLEIKGWSGVGYSKSGLNVVGSDSIYYCIIRNNLLHDDADSTDYGSDGISVAAGSGSSAHKIYNNIIYNITGDGIMLDNYGIDSFAYNNTVYNSNRYGFFFSNGHVAINNISQNSALGDFSGGVTGNSGYNISSDGTAPGSNSKTNSNVSFVSVALGSEDLHLSQGDDVATNAGISLILYFNDDIDGGLRSSSTWDVGADEKSIRIYRSVGPGATGLLDSDASHSDTLSVNGASVVFESAVADNIGIGDVLLVDTGGSNNSIDNLDALLFIQERINSNNFTVRTHTGAIPNLVTTNNDTWQIYRAYTSLANAEAGTKNTSIPITFNGGNRDLVANNEQWNIICYANGATADTTAVNVDGWVTNGSSFLKIYTPYQPTEVKKSQRHSGQWDNAKYKLEITTDVALNISDPHTRVTGLQLKVTKGDFNPYVLRVHLGGDNSFIDGNIIVTNFSGTASGAGVLNMSPDVTYANNIIYSAGAVLGRGIVAGGGNVLSAYNNTVYNLSKGYSIDWGGITGKNNIAQNCTVGFEALEVASSNNITETSAQEGAVGLSADSGTVDGTTTSKLVDSTQNFLTTVKVGNIIKNTIDTTYTYVTAVDSDTQLSVADDIFVSGETYTIYTNKYGTVSFVDEANKDFHLSRSDTLAQNGGTDLSTYFSTDIDGAARNASINAWDIGIDETATRIFRSVGPGKTDALATDNSHANTVTIASGVATFSASLADNIGVGDAVLIDTNDDQSITSADTLLFIKARNSPTSYQLQTNDGSIPGGIAINDTYQVYRAYASLADAESGTINSGINALGLTFNGGNRDILINNEEWNIACYANGTTADATAVNIENWNTSAQSFIKIFTPVSTSETGISQRHRGVIGDNVYSLNDSLVISTGYSYIDGIQFVLSEKNAITLNFNATTITHVSNSIMQGSSSFGLYSYDASGVVYAWNNIIYGFTAGISLNRSSNILNNNTIIDCDTGIWKNGDQTMNNNIVSDSSVVDYYSNGGASNGSKNLSSDNSALGADSVLSATVLFLDEANKNFHLALSDIVARGVGVNLTSDSGVPNSARITNDIDGQLRNPSGAGWDIGADEGTVEFVATVMQSGGNFSTLSSWEDAMDSDLVADTTRVFAHGGITGTIVGGNTVTGLTSGATATVVYATSTQILLHTVSGIFQSGETLEVTAGNSVVISDNGNPASAVAKIDGAWTAADTTAVTVDGWATSYDNYIKVYTTSNARHNGKWDEGKYRYQTTAALGISESYVKIDGLEIFNNNTDSWALGIANGGAGFPSGDGAITLSNNIIRGNNPTGTNNSAILFYVPTGISTAEVEIYNNIIYDWGDAASNIIVMYVPNWYIYSNTIIGGAFGIYYHSGVAIIKNNIVAFASDPFIGTFDTSSTNNATDVNDVPTGAVNTLVNQTFKFISIESGNEDFHLDPDDTAAKNAGTDLSAYFTTDIDGNTRNVSISPWDIGADESLMRIFRSVGPSAADALTNDATHTKNVTVTSGVATFSAGLPDNVGVGDVVIIDTGGADQTIDGADTLLFISGRNSSTSYNLRTHTGAMPANITSNDTWQIYRAHTSLSNAEAGTINSTLSGLGFAFNGGNRDLIANNEEWNIACYANGTTADTTAVTVDGWTTGPYNFLKVYTPVSATEVGVSQRHKGKWDEGKYYLSTIDPYRGSMNIYSSYIFIDGIQIKYIPPMSYGNLWVVSIGDANNGSGIKNSIITSIDAYSNNIRGIGIGDASGKKHYISNNIIYGSGLGEGIEVLYSGTAYVYNNTIHGATKGINLNSGAIFAKNNITQNCADGYVGTFDASSDYNISDISSDAPNATFTGGFADVKFVNESADDFHLASTDTSAKNMGLNLSADSILPFNTDIDGQSRPTGPDWDIGADEITDAESVRMKGDVKMKGDVRMR